MLLHPEDPAADRNVTRDHYNRLAASYDENWAYSPAFVEWMSECILRRLRITSGDLVADIGCGTGLYARGLAGQASAVVCVDQSAAMLAQLPADDRLIPIVASVEEVAAGRVVLPHASFDAMLLKEVLHHVGDRAPVITGLAGLLRPGGRMLVAMLPKTIDYPLFAAALDLYASHQPDPVGVAVQMRAAGLEAELTEESFPLAFPADRYLRMVRNRYMSLLAYFDDDQLEAGVEEIRRAHRGEEITFADRFAFILGVKR